MPTVSINHTTRYRYRRDVAFGEHRILVRPRESFDQRVLSATLAISPEPQSLRWLQDVFGNAVAVATFATRSDELEVRGAAEVELLPTCEADIAVEPYAQTYPFTYSAEDMPDLLRSIERGYPDRDREIDSWARRFVRHGNGSGTLALLMDMTESVKAGFEYNRRETKGIQPPLETLARGSGMIETARLVLRDWCEADVAPFVRHTNRPAVMRWLGGVMAEDAVADMVRDRLMRWQEERGFTFWVVERKEDEAFLGFCGLKVADGEGSSVADDIEIGWRLREDAWGRGYAKEAATASLDFAFGTLDAPRVVALTMMQNEASWRLMERLGMTRRADLDYHEPRWGDLNPIIVYAIERGGWRP